MNARAPKRLSDSKWLMFVDHFYFLNHACNSKSRRYNASWRSIQNENSAFSPFNRQGWLDRKMRFQKVSICWHFQTNQSQRVWEIHWRRNNHKATKFHKLYESKVFYPSLLVFYPPFRDERPLNKYRSFHQATPKMTFFHIFKAYSNISRNFGARKCARAYSARQSMRM